MDLPSTSTLLKDQEPQLQSRRCTKSLFNKVRYIYSDGIQRTEGMIGEREEFEPSSALLAKSRHFAGKSGESNPRSHSTTEAALS